MFRNGTRIFSIALAFLSFCAPVFAADSTGQAAPVPGGGIGALIMWYVCGSRKKQEIGGWLLYYYIQLYLAVIVSLVIFGVSFNNYRPSSWSAQPTLYPLFLLSTVPGLLISPIQLILAEKLRKSRESAWIPTLRRVLWIELATAVLAIVLDFNYFDQNSTALDALGVIWPAVWLPYFYVSNRVKRVFFAKNWLISGSLVAPTS